MPMTEKRWLAAQSWINVIDHVEKPKHARKLRLFGCACCRRVWEMLTDAASRGAVEAAERFADGEIGKAELTLARKAAKRAIGRGPARDYTPKQWAAEAAMLVTLQSLGDSGRSAAGRAAGAVHDAKVRHHTDEKRLHLPIFKDIFGNPFRPVVFDPQWRSESAVALARTAYDTRDFALMPILADALEEAGCDSPEVLAHCRDPRQVHVRGCWVLDGVLDKR
jgi:hypothetical protein